MNRRYDLVMDIAILVMVVIVSGAIGYAVLDTASQYEPRAVLKGSETRPDIPKCDKELWLRIKDGCADAAPRTHAGPLASPHARFEEDDDES